MDRKLFYIPQWCNESGDGDGDGDEEGKKKYIKISFGIILHDTFCFSSLAAASNAIWYEMRKCLIKFKEKLFFWNIIEVEMRA